MGNEYLKLAGNVTGAISGLNGLSIRINDENLSSADEVTEDGWSFIPITQVGAGCHDFAIRAEDIAGNVETEHDFATSVVWSPRYPPDLSGSSFTITPAEVPPGGRVDFVVNLRNSGWQEAWIPVEVDIPTGLEVLPDTILGDGQYNGGTRIITWLPEYLWPGATRTLSFSAMVDIAHPSDTLEIPLNGLGTWPITDGCPAEEIPGFDELGTTVEMMASVIVNPWLPIGHDVVQPDPPNLSITEGFSTPSQDVQLLIEADAEDAMWMYLREWTWNADEETWSVAQESGWLPYSPIYPWTLSDGDGVKYLGVWMADAAWNISTMDQRNLAFTNYLARSQTLSDGQRIQYRFPLFHGQLALFNLVTHEGNFDLYVWQAFNGFRPDHAATSVGYVDTVGFESVGGGVHLVEVQAEGDSQYQLLLSGDIDPNIASSSQLTGNTPDHPLTVSDPLSSGVATAPDFPHTLPADDDG